LKIIVFFLLGVFSVSLQAEVSEFQRLMGKETRHFAHVSRENDLQTLEKLQELYQRNQHFRLSKGSNYKIPKIIHFIWVGPRAFPPESVEYIRRWIGYHPDWKIKFWTDRERIAPCTSMEMCDVNAFPFLFLRHRYEQSRDWKEKSDILRFEILYQEGGLYVDHRAKCLRNFDGLHVGYDFFCGLRTPHFPIAGHNITSSSAVIGARPFHPVVGRVMEIIGKNWDSLSEKYPGKDTHSRRLLVEERTYITLSHALKDRLEEDGNIDIVFPAAYFFSRTGIPALYSQHLFVKNSIDESIPAFEFEKNTKKVMTKLKKRNNRIRWIGRGALVLNLLAFTAIFLYLVRMKRRQKNA